MVFCSAVSSCVLKTSSRVRVHRLCGPARGHFLPARPATFPCLPSRARVWRSARPHGPCMCASAGARPCTCPVDTTAQLRGVTVSRRLRRAGWAGRRRTQNNPPCRPAHVSARHRALPVAVSPYHMTAIVTRCCVTVSRQATRSAYVCLRRGPTPSPLLTQVPLLLRSPSPLGRPGTTTNEAMLTRVHYLRLAVQVCSATRSMNANTPSGVSAPG